VTCQACKGPYGFHREGLSHFDIGGGAGKLKKKDFAPTNRWRDQRAQPQQPPREPGPTKFKLNKYSEKSENQV
jgi:hypothetical protein